MTSSQPEQNQPQSIIRKIFVQCAKCNQPLEVELVNPTIINRVFVTLVVIEHPNLITCKCGTTVTLFATGLGGMNFVAIPVPEEVKSNLITTPPPGFDPKRKLV